mmetsp:Transcript_8250/g.34481  ORF Transcript_8250/g.34481 Transcript_8250/m.34481 type:complete len:384 (+) Transcript_8250:2795-3946(+)
MRSITSRFPDSINASASSSTKKRTFRTSKTPLSTRSTTRPGVPTATSHPAPFLSTSVCAFFESRPPPPPTNSAVPTFGVARCVANDSKNKHVCSASSRVGSTIRARGVRGDEAVPTISTGTSVGTMSSSSSSSSSPPPSPSSKSSSSASSRARRTSSSSSSSESLVPSLPLPPRVSVTSVACMAAMRWRSLSRSCAASFSIGAFFASRSSAKNARARSKSFGAKSTASRLRAIQSALRSAASTTARAAFLKRVTCVALQKRRRSRLGTCASSGNPGEYAHWLRCAANSCSAPSTITSCTAGDRSSCFATRRTREKSGGRFFVAIGALFSSEKPSSSSSSGATGTKCPVASDSAFSARTSRRRRGAYLAEGSKRAAPSATCATG